MKAKFGYFKYESNALWYPMLFAIYSVAFSLKCSSNQYTTPSKPATQTKTDMPVVSPANTSPTAYIPVTLPTNGTLPATTQNPNAGSKFTGDSTKYSASGQGSCQTAISDKDMSVALNSPQYGNVGQKSEFCGKTVCVCGNDPAQPDKKCITAVVSNTCPECKQGDLDMTGATWEAVWPSHPDGSRFKISWNFGSC